MTPRLTLLLVAVALAGGSVMLVAQRRAVRLEVGALGAARAQVAGAAGDARLAAEVDRIRLALEGARLRSARTAEAHLALALGDGVLTLERGEIVLRTATVEANVPRGAWPVERVEAGVITLADGITLRSARDADSLTVRTVRVPAADFAAILPNVKPGQMAYFF